MSAIAARLGGSKGTLYSYFANKEDLFFACVSRHCALLEEQMQSLLTGESALEDTLMRIGQRYVSFVASEDVVRKFRMVVGEAERTPSLSCKFYEVGPARGAEVVARYFEQAMRDGALRDADPLRAANHFLGLCYNWLSKARLCAAEPEPSPERVREEVTEAVRVFFAAYGLEKRARR